MGWRVSPLGPAPSRIVAGRYDSTMLSDELIEDLAAEHGALDAIVAGVSDREWRTATASPGWSVADQIKHLAYYDDAAVLAMTDQARFAALRDEIFTAALDPNGDRRDGLVDERYENMSSAELLESWRASRAGLLLAASNVPAGQRVEWFGPSMSLPSFLTARLMETWAHGQDVADALGATRDRSDRLAHIAQLGVITRGWSYANRQADQPSAEIRIELVLPSGRSLDWGPADAGDSIVGDAEDFCLVVTQRRNVADTSLVVAGPAAEHWMGIAQIFAGPPTDPPAPFGQDR